MNDPNTLDAESVIDLLVSEIGKLFAERAKLQVTVQSQAERLVDLEKALMELAKIAIDTNNE